MEGDRYIVTSGSDSDSSESYSDGSGDNSYSDSSCNSESSRYYGTYSDSLQSDSESSESCRSTSSSGDSSDDTHSHSSESSYCASRSSSSSLADREAQRQSTADKPEESDPENSHRLPESSVDVDPSLHRPLYSGSCLTVLESCLLLLQLLLRSVLAA